MPESVATADSKPTTGLAVGSMTISATTTAEATPAAAEIVASDKKLEDAKESESPDTAAVTPMTDEEPVEKNPGEKVGTEKKEKEAETAEKKDGPRASSISKKDEKKEKAPAAGSRKETAPVASGHFADALKSTPAKKFEDRMKKILEEVDEAAKEVKDDETRLKLTTLISKAKFLLDDSAELFNKMANFSVKKPIPGGPSKPSAGTGGSNSGGAKGRSQGPNMKPAASPPGPPMNPNAQQRRPGPQQPINMSVQRRLFGNQSAAAPPAVMAAHHSHFDPAAPTPNYGPDVLFQRPDFQSQPAQQPLGAFAQPRMSRLPAGPGSMTSSGWVYPMHEGSGTALPNQRRPRRDIVLKEQSQANVRKALREATTTSQLEKAVARAQRLHMTYEVGNAKSRLQKLKAEAASRPTATPAAESAN